MTITDRRKAEILDACEALARKRLDPAEGPAVAAIARLLYRNVAPADLLRVEPEGLYAAALDLRRFASVRPAGTALVRLLNPTTDVHGWRSRHTVLEIVNDDMPFLVDSVMAALQEAGLSVHLIAHPILAVERDEAGRLLSVAMPGDPAGEKAIPESWMHIEVDEVADPATSEALHGRIVAALADVRAAVADWQAMRDAVRDAAAALEQNRPAELAPELLAETRAFLDWLDDDHFVFLGYRRYAFSFDGTDVPTGFGIVEGSGLGILRRPDVSVFEGMRDWAGLDEARRAHLRDPAPLTVTKANLRSTVHRAVHLDVVLIKSRGPDGRVTGEHMAVGLFTSAAYAASPREIPWLRGKVARTIERAGLDPRSHDGKALIHILDTYPRDDLFDIAEDELLSIATGILELQERSRTALFARRDPYGRFVSALVFVPRDRHSTELRRKMQGILERAYAGTLVAFSTRMTEGAQTCIHFVLRTEPGRPQAEPNEIIEAKLVEASRSWGDVLQEALIERFGEARGLALARSYADAFPAGYRESNAPRYATGDIERIEGLAQTGGLGIVLRRPVEAAAHVLHFELYNVGRPVPLSDVLPVLEHLGLRVLAELPTEITPRDGERVWLHDFTVETRRGTAIDLATAAKPFQEAFRRIWNGDAEDDGLNALVLGAGLGWRQVQILRAYARFLRQARFAYAGDTVEATLTGHPTITRAIVRLFEARFDPDLAGDRDAAQAAIRAEIGHALDAVDNLDEDRILRRFADLVTATLRTNFWQERPEGGPKPYLSLKLDSRAIEDLPAPRPWREIFVHSPRMEGVHLRGGPVARGGIRWSDRREDFRTEILGLMKAQTVKNAVIVPVGAKGGFVLKRPPTAGGREAMAAEGVECYRILIRGMLDLTDTIETDGVRHPERVVRHDADDPYLVVAADKGTATFSDIANAISLEYGFWLGDAFASGGSAGYDHKVMGITARGAWISVRRHFHEMGRDIQAEPFTCVGVGDMAGDVFGNGMLLSDKTKLVAAFNHLHIFVDPDPDPAVSFAERRRLFRLGRGSWDGYDAAKLSAGGAVFDRKAKALTPSPEVRALLGLADETVTPAEMIRAILKAGVDLLWFGGIGTFVKARRESHADAGDKSNDALRIDATEIRAAVVGEGANLAMTQAARVEYALAGGRLNTDFIDNSAGVDCSDHEVNIKILLGAVVQAGDMTLKQRDALLVEMTDEVGALVLEDNDGQTRALSLAVAQAATLLDREARLIRTLEKAGRIDRALDGLPDDETIADRAAERRGLTRPEEAVLLSHVKLALQEVVIASDLPDDPGLAGVLGRYFPTPLRDGFADVIARHRLRREIVTTRIASEIVDRMGVVFPYQTAERTGHPLAEVVRAYAIARGAFDLPALWEAIEILDGKASAEAQTEMLQAVRGLADRAVGWLLRSGAREVAKTVERLRPGLAAFEEVLDGAMHAEARRVVDERATRWAAAGVPEALARSAASLNLRAAGLDVLRIAERVPQVPLASVAATYFATGGRFGFAALRDAGRTIPPAGPWTADAVEAASEDLYALQADTAAHILSDGAADSADAVAAWAAQHRPAVDRIDRLMTELRGAAAPDVAMLTVAARALRALAAG